MTNKQISINVPDVHIGNEIKKYLKDHKISQAKMSRSLNMYPSNFARILKRKSIASRTLEKVSNAAGYNFFLLWCVDFPSEQAPFPVPSRTAVIKDSIKSRLKELHMTQIEFASKLGVTSANVSLIKRKTFFDTDKLAEFSRILGRNFFYVYCTVESSMLNESDSLLVIENARLKEELSTAKMEIARLRYTV